MLSDSETAEKRKMAPKIKLPRKQKEAYSEPTSLTGPPEDEGHMYWLRSINSADRTWEQAQTISALVGDYSEVVHDQMLWLQKSAASHAR